MDPQEEAAFAQLASVGSQEPLATSSAGAATDSNGEKKEYTMEDVNKAVSLGIVNNIMTQESESRTKLEKVLRGEDPE